MHGETVPGYYVTQSNVEKKVYLMNDGYFYLNVDYGNFPLQRCIMNIYTNSSNHKNYPLAFNSDTYEYLFKIWNTGMGWYVRGSGKKLNTKKPALKKPTKKPVENTKKPIKKTPVKKPAVKKPVKKPTKTPVENTKKLTTKKPPKKKSTKK